MDTQITRGQELLQAVSLVTEELALVNKGKYETDRAKKMAALALKTQMDMLDILADAEAKTKIFKNAVEYEESKSYFEQKKSGEKLTETALKHLINSSENVRESKDELITAEKQYKKWQNCFNLLKDAHIFFRNFGNKGDF